jgi:hypothetical protein
LFEKSRFKFAEGAAVLFPTGSLRNVKKGLSTLLVDEFQALEINCRLFDL